MLGLTAEQVQAAVDYIDANDLDVLRDNVKILERVRRGNPPEIQAKLDAHHQKFQELLWQIKEVRARSAAEVKELIERYRDARAEEHAHAGTASG